ncbi:hypothetical protein [Geothrix sp. 21YS21S-2]|uniref:hypothetical protein n=1 Tax=Geothrix sp. 21YS21S-2 TaxID=3068893 RepID=UPI0027B940F6|nr:hypothetical protein [Geothrix sp. 21YS21S-2]
MLKIAVVGAGALLGRELVDTLEARDCSVLPLSHGPTTVEEELGDVVIFAPSPALLEEIELVILAETPLPEILEGFKGRILDLRPDAEASLEPMPLNGPWPKGKLALRNRPAVEQVLATLPRLVGGIGEVGGTHLRSVAFQGDRGLDGLLEQTMAVLKGEDPSIEKLGYRAAFEVIPQFPRGRFVEVRVPAFHGDLLVLHLTAAPGGALTQLEAPQGVTWSDHPPSSREVSITPELLAHLSLSDEGRAGVLTLGFDPILWGTLMPVLRLLEL